MGRYISGDIDHKFWFGTQNSNAASQFGGEQENNYIPYFYGSMDEFDIEHLEGLIADMNTKYGSAIKLDTDPELLYKLGSTRKEQELWWKKVQNDTLVADVQLGLRIYQCIEKNGYCEFEAEI